MSKVVRPDGKEVTFTYDSIGRRIEKRFDGMVYCYVWDGNNILHEWEAAEQSNDNDRAGASSQDKPSADSLTTWIFEDGTFHPAAKITSEGTFSIITDHLGTPVEMYNEAGEQVWSCELDIYGRVRNWDLVGKRGACPFRYPGQYEDEETGLYYNRFRYYSPVEGMYTQQDPLRLDGGFQLYGYVHDPNAWIDPLGLVSLNTLKGDAAELAYENMLKNNGFNVFMAIKNKSNHGTDIIAQHMATNKIFIFEVKANTSRMSKKQKGTSYIKDIFTEIGKKGKLRGQQLDQKTISMAEDIKNAINNYGMSSYEVRYKVDSSLNTTYSKINKWSQCRP
ncbi:putative deoxyribonuclease RhsC [compost metagenome]